MTGSLPRDGVKQILFVTYGGGHVNMLLPLIRHFQRLQDIDVRILALTAAQNRLAGEGIAFYRVMDFLQDDDSAVFRWGKQLAEQTGPHNLPLDEVIAYLGVGYTELVRNIGEQEAALQFQRLGRGAFLPVDFMQRVMRRLKPDVLVSTNSPRMERAAFLAARELGVPRICIVGTHASKGLDWLAEHEYASVYCAISDHQREKMLELGISPSRVQVTGNPMFDRLANPGLMEKGGGLRRRLGWKNKKVILWASQKEPAVHPQSGELSDPGIPSEIERSLIEMLDRHPEWCLIVRPHPNEERDSLGPDEQRLYFSKRDEDIAELISASDVVVTMTSTAGLESAMLGKAVVSPQWSVFSPESYYVEAKIAQPAMSLAELEQKVGSVLAGKGVPGSGRWLPVATEATATIASVICDQMSGRQGDRT